MLDDALAGLEAKIEAVERGIALFQLINRTQTLQIVLEAPEVAHAFVQGILPGVAEWRVTEVVRQRNGFGEILVEAQGTGNATGDLGDLQAVRQAGTEEIALVIDENLRLVLEPAESSRVDDAVTIALELAAQRRTIFDVATTARIGGSHRVGGKLRHLRHGPKWPH